MESHSLKLTAKEKLRGNWKIAVLVCFLAALLGGTISGSNIDLTFGLDSDDLGVLPEPIIAYLRIAAPIALIIAVVQLFTGGMIRMGLCRFLLNLYDGEYASLDDLFSQKHRFTDGFCLELLKALYIFLWSLLFIIPGIIASLRYSMASFILYENPGMTPNEAITASKEMTYGHKLDLFVLDLSFIGWDFLAILTLGVGFLWLNPYRSMTYACFYRTLSP